MMELNYRSNSSGKMAENFLELRGITKKFGKVIANDHIDLSIARGEIHTLLGENGAGKSTLVSIIYGFYHADEGTLLVNGQPTYFATPNDAIAARIGMVYQNFMLIPTLSVAKNVILGLKKQGYFLNLENVRSRIKNFCQKYKIDIDPDAEIWKLSVGQQQWVEILKALYVGIDLLILDEPTAVLTPQETSGLLKSICEMNKTGLTVIFISHKLEEVMQISDKITVLRRGQVISTVIPEKVTKNDLARMMVGKDIDFHIKKQAVKPGKIVLKLDSVRADSDLGYEALHSVSIDVHEKEIVGIAGVAGNGQKEIYETIIRARPIKAGRIFIEGEDVTCRSRADLQNIALSAIPADRIKYGSVPDFSVAENMILGIQRKKTFHRGILLDKKKITTYAKQIIDHYDIRVPSPFYLSRTLSGGNLQKAILARELSKSPHLILAFQPTRGLDIAAIDFTRKRFLQERNAGKAILLISEDLEELMDLSDIIGVIYKGRIVAWLRPEETSLVDIGLFMLGKNSSRMNYV